MIRQQLEDKHPKAYNHRMAFYGLSGVGKPRLRLNTVFDMASNTVACFGLAQ
jgi:hypothetical protein